MSPFWSGFLGAFAALFVLFALRRLFWFAAFRRWHHGGVHGPRARFVWWFRRLGARPEQERILRAELDALLFDLRGLRGEADTVRAELARLLGAEALDEAAVAAVLDPPLARLGELRGKVAGALARVHASLDAAQREKLAAMVAHGHRRHGHAH